MTNHPQVTTGDTLKRLYYSRDHRLFGVGHVYTDYRLVHNATVICFGKVETLSDLDEAVNGINDAYTLMTETNDTFTSVITDIFDRVVVAGWSTFHNSKKSGILGIIQLLTSELHLVDDKKSVVTSKDSDVIFLEANGFFNDIRQFGLDYWAVGGTEEGQGLIVRLDNNFKLISRRLINENQSGRREIKQLYQHDTGFLGLMHEVIDGEVTSVLIDIDGRGEDKPVKCTPTSKFHKDLVNDLVIIPDDGIYLVGTGQGESITYSFISRVDNKLSQLLNSFRTPVEYTNGGVNIVFDEKRDLFHITHLKRSGDQSHRSVVTSVHRDSLAGDGKNVKVEVTEMDEGLLLSDVVLINDGVVIYGGRRVHENGVNLAIGSIGGAS